MRSILVTGQKGGVGKTTAALNLAAAAGERERVLLLDLDPVGAVCATLGRNPEEGEGVELGGCAGLLHRDAVSGVDVFVPRREAGRRMSAGRVGGMLRAAEAEGGYALAIVDPASMKGAEDRELLGACDEIVLVGRAEPFAVRTLTPLLTALGQEMERREVAFHGFLLTLPPGMSVGAVELEELRASFGSRMFPELVAHDEEVERAALLGQPVVRANPQAVSSRAFRGVASRIGCGGEQAEEQRVARLEGNEAAEASQSSEFGSRLVMGMLAAVVVGGILGVVMNWLGR